MLGGEYLPVSKETRKELKEYINSHLQSYVPTYRDGLYIIWKKSWLYQSFSENPYAHQSPIFQKGELNGDWIYEMDISFDIVNPLINTEKSSHIYIDGLNSSFKRYRTGFSFREVDFISWQRDKKLSSIIS
jgi:hypothetical protein